MKRIKFLRIERGWSQKDLGRATQINTSVICNIERGRTVPRPDELDRLGRALNCPPDRLFDHVCETLPDGAEYRDSVRNAKESE
jgi:transcriptional regulator with XRE-family HTH domain